MSQNNLPLADTTTYKGFTIQNFYNPENRTYEYQVTKLDGEEIASSGIAGFESQEEAFTDARDEINWYLSNND